MEEGENVDRVMVNKIAKGEGKDVANRRYIEEKNEGSTRPSAYINKTQK